MDNLDNLKVDPARAQTRLEAPNGEAWCTGISIRAMGPDGKWGAHDLIDLDRDSVVAWVRSRGPVTPWAVNVVLHLLGFDGCAMVDV